MVLGGLTAELESPRLGGAGSPPPTSACSAPSRHPPMTASQPRSLSATYPEPELPSGLLVSPDFGPEGLWPLQPGQ